MGSLFLVSSGHLLSLLRQVLPGFTPSSTVILPTTTKTVSLYHGKAISPIRILSSIAGGTFNIHRITPSVSLLESRKVGLTFQLSVWIGFNTTVDATGNSLASLDNSASSRDKPFTGDSSCGPNVTCGFQIYDPNNFSNFHAEGTFWTVTQNDNARGTTYSASSTTVTTFGTTIQRASPLTNTTLPYATPSPNTTTSGTRTSLPSSSTPTLLPSSSGPSQGAAAGIGIGAAAAMATVVLVAFLCFRRRRQQLQRKRESAPGLMDVKGPQDLDHERKHCRKCSSQLWEN